MATEFTKKKVHLLTGRIDKPKYKVRYATLGADSLAMYKRPGESLACDFVPTEKILGAEVVGERSKKFVIKVILDKMDPIHIATDTSEECDIWANQLSRAKTLKDLQNWVIHPDLVKLETQIGVGAFGIVWRGSMSGAPVAVKEMRQSVGDDEVEKEIHLLSKIRNPYCVRLLGIYRNEAAAKLFIVTEFIEGGDLSKAIYAAPPRSLSEEVKLKIIRDVARGIAFLHENSIIHRDLKTDNCLVRSISPGASQFAVVADFGISKIAPNMGELGANLTMGVGTPVYMAPECFRKNYTTQLDVYSFGVLMNEVFSEERPWSHVDTNFNAVIHDKVDEGERPRFQFSAREYPHCAEIQQIITGCWLGDVKARWTMKKALEALDALIAKIESNPNRLVQSDPYRAPNANPLHATHLGTPHAAQPAAPSSLYSTFSPAAGGGYGAAPSYGGPAQSYGSPSYHSQPGGTVPPYQPQPGGAPSYQSQVGGARGAPTYQSQAGPYQSQAGGVPSYQSQAGGARGVPSYQSQAGGAPSYQSQAGGVPSYQSQAGGPQSRYSSVTGGQGRPSMPNQGSDGTLYSSVAGGYSPQTHVSPSGGLPNIGGLNLNKSGGPRGAAPAPPPPQAFDNDFGSHIIGYLESFGGEVAAPQLGQFVSSAGVSPRDAAVFAEHLANVFSAGAPGAVTVNAILLMKQWFFPIVVDPPSSSGGDLMYESDPSQSLYEDSAAPTQIGWRIPQINYLLGSPFFKAFMDGPTTNGFLKERGSAPGQYLVRFSGTEAGKLALSALDNSMAVRHWKITLFPGGKVVETSGNEFDSIVSWLAFRKETPFQFPQGTLAITEPCP